MTTRLPCGGARFGLGAGALFLAIAIGASGWGRASARASSQAPDQQPPRSAFRSEANYVRVDVFPTANGQPVLDLRQDDFEILEDRVPQKVAQFEHIEIRGHVPQDQRREPNTMAASRAMLEESRARVFVVFLDINHVDVGGSHNIRKPLTAALERLIGPEDLFGVMTPEMSAAEVTFARRSTTLDGILARHWDWGERSRLTTLDPVERSYEQCYPGFGPNESCADDDRGLAREMIDRRREKVTLDALEDLARFLHGVREERKAVIAISDGWRLYRPNLNLARRVFCQVPGTPEVGVDPRTGKIAAVAKKHLYAASLYECDRDRLNLAQIDNEQLFRRILDEANRANTSFYPIDPRGLPVFDTPIVPAGDPAGALPPMVPLAVDAAQLRGRIESLRTLAENTDGIAIVDSNNIANGFKRIVDDLSSYYLLGYYSTGKLDGRFHSITVRVKRPGVQVRARRGYLAPSQAELAAASAAAASAAAGAASGGAGESAALAEAHTIAALVAPLNASARELPIRLHVVAGWTPGNGAAVWAVGELPAGDEWRGGGQADLTLLNAAGTTLASAHVQLDAGTRRFRTSLAASSPIAAGEYAVRVRARGDGPSAIPASETVRFALPAAPDAAGAVLMRRGPATGKTEVATADPRFRRNEQIRVEVLAPATGPVSARLLDRMGKVLALPVAASVRDEGDGSRWHTAQLALAPLAVGDYVIELAGGTGESGGSAQQQKRTLIAFRVIP